MNRWYDPSLSVRVTRVRVHATGQAVLEDDDMTSPTTPVLVAVPDLREDDNHPEPCPICAQRDQTEDMKKINNAPQTPWEQAIFGSRR